MNRILVCLTLGIFLISGICLAAGNRAALDAANNPVIVQEVKDGIVGEITETLKHTPEANVRQLLENAMLKRPTDISEAQRLKVLVKYDQLTATNAANPWQGIVPPEQAAPVIAAATAELAKAKPRVTPGAQLKADEAELMAQTSEAMGKPVEQIVLPDFIQVDQSVMDTAKIQGPVIVTVNGQKVVVVGDADITTLRRGLRSRWAHELAELTYLAMGETPENAHAKACDVEGKVRIARINTVEERASQVGEASAEITYQIAGILPATGVKKIKVAATVELQNSAEWKAIKEFYKGRGYQVTEAAAPQLAPGFNNCFKITLEDADGRQVGKEAVRNIKGQLCQVNGIINEGLLDALIPAAPAEAAAIGDWAKSNEQKIRMLLEQRKAIMTGNEAEVKKIVDLLKADPSKWPQGISDLRNLELPKPMPNDFTLQLEQKMAAEILGRMA